jgi:hypothetical protein
MAAAANCWKTRTRKDLVASCQAMVETNLWSSMLKFPFSELRSAVSCRRGQRATVPTDKIFALAFLAHCVTT